MSTPVLSLPGTIKGLLRRGSPVHGDNGMRGVVVRVDKTSVVIAWDFPKDQEGCAVEDDYPLDSPYLSLDLSDSTGRAHAASWLWGKMKDHVEPIIPCTAPEWLACPDAWSLGASHVPACGEVAFATFGARGDADPSVDEVVAAFANLNPNDPRLLPDGSRYVDAEALKLACLHVVGVDP